MWFVPEGWWWLSSKSQMCHGNQNHIVGDQTTTALAVAQFQPSVMHCIGSVKQHQHCIKRGAMKLYKISEKDWKPWKLSQFIETW